MAGAVILVLFSAENNPYECFRNYHYCLFGV